MPEEKLIAEKTHLRCKIIIEVLGKPKEHVEKALQMYVDKINNDSDLIVLKKTIYCRRTGCRFPGAYL